MPEPSDKDLLMAFFDTLTHFKAHEFKHPELMSRFFLRVLDDLRDRCDFAFEITSDGRTVEENRKAGGAKNSAHLRGLAVDIKIPDSRRRFILLREVMNNPAIQRVGIGKTFIHIDIDKDLPQMVTWLY